MAVAWDEVETAFTTSRNATCPVAAMVEAYLLPNRIVSHIRVVTGNDGHSMQDSGREKKTF